MYKPLIASLLLAGTALAEPFTYQGKLDDNGQPANGLYDFQFRLLTDSDPNAAVETDIVQVDDIPVENGVFTTLVDFTATFSGKSRWLEIRVRPGASTGPYTALTPTQFISTTPLAQLALQDDTGWDLAGNAPGTGAILGTTNNVPMEIRVNGQQVMRLMDATDSSINHAPNILLGGKFNEIANGVAGATLSGGGGDSSLSNCGNGNQTCINRIEADYAVLGGGWGNTVSGPYAIAAGGANNKALGAYSSVQGGNFNTTNADLSVVGGGSYNYAAGNESVIAGGSSNRAPAPFSSIGGGYDNQASGTNSHIGGGQINEATALNSTIAGGSGNIAYGPNSTVGGGKNHSAGGQDSTVAGGSGNTASGNYSFVGGGYGHTASGNAGTIGGGGNNQAPGTNSVVAGGIANTASGSESTVAGGSGNTASATGSLVAGGLSNLAASSYAMVLGGVYNRAGGTYSFAAGRNAKVRDGDTASSYYSGDSNGDEGTFMWADSTNTPFVSTGPNQFLVRASGGVWLGSSSTVSFPTGSFLATSTGAYLTTGGTWTNSSDENRKENFQPVDGEALLNALATLPIQRWNYKAEDDAVLHIGPTAQAFRAAFGLGHGETHIATVDADGVALAAIQALTRQLARERERTARLAAEVATLQRQQAEMAELRQMLHTLLARSHDMDVPESR